VRYRVWDTVAGNSDEERAKFGVPDLSEQRRRAEDLTRDEPQPPMEFAPQWLKDAIRRWQASEMDGA
jgi:hypothetical protein